MEHLVAEFKKKNCNKIILKKLLKLTYEKRRIEISSCQTRLTEILDKYRFFASKFCVRSHRCPINTKELHSFL